MNTLPRQSESSTRLRCGLSCPALQVVSARPTALSLRTETPPDEDKRGFFAKIFNGSGSKQEEGAGKQEDGDRDLDGWFHLSLRSWPIALEHRRTTIPTAAAVFRHAFLIKMLIPESHKAALLPAKLDPCFHLRLVRRETKSRRNRTFGARAQAHPGE